MKSLKKTVLESFLPDYDFDFVFNLSSDSTIIPTEKPEYQSTPLDAAFGDWKDYREAGVAVPSELWFGNCDLYARKYEIIAADISEKRNIEGFLAVETKTGNVLGVYTSVDYTLRITKLKLVSGEDVTSNFRNEISKKFSYFSDFITSVKKIAQEL